MNESRKSDLEADAEFEALLDKNYGESYLTRPPTVTKTKSIPIRKHVTHTKRRATNLRSSFASIFLSDDKEGFTARFVEFVDTDFAFVSCILCVILYFVLSVLAFSFYLEQWTPIDSLYFAVVTFTTVGYGDLSPDSEAAKIFVTFYILFGVSIVAVALGIAAERILERQTERSEKSGEQTKKRVINMVNKEEHHSGDDAAEEFSYCSSLTKLVISHAKVLLFLTVLCGIIGYLEGWSPVDSLYYGVVTFTTVGYGDIHPDTPLGRLISVVFLPLSVIVLAKFLCSIADIYLEHQEKKNEEEFFNRELTLSDLKEMDANNNGQVSFGEFLSFMLVAMQKVDKEMIDELQKLFDEWDETKGGFLCKEDLILHAWKKKGQNSRN